MKKTVTVAVITTLLTNYLLASPWLLFLIFWFGTAILTLKLDKHVTEFHGIPREFDFKENPGWFIITFILPPCMLIAFFLSYFNDIIPLFKENFPKFRLPKLRNPFIW